MDYCLKLSIIIVYYIIIYVNKLKEKSILTELKQLIKSTSIWQYATICHVVPHGLQPNHGLNCISALNMSLEFCRY